MNTTAAALTRAFFSYRSRVAAALAATGGLAIASVLPLHHWPASSLMVLLVGAGAALVNAGLRAAIGGRLPRWSLHDDVLSGNLFVSVAVAASATEHVNLANLYLLVEVFALLYLPIRSALGHLTLAGAAYAIMLDVGPRTAEPPIIAGPARHDGPILVAVQAPAGGSAQAEPAGRARRVRMGPIEETRPQLAPAFGEAVAADDLPTGEHSARVGALARAVGRCVISVTRAAHRKKAQRWNSTS